MTEEENIHIEEAKTGDTLETFIKQMHIGSLLPSHKVTTAMEAVLKAAFEDTQVRTHVLTGSLKASGKTESDFDGEVWSGKIEYGGILWGTPAPGPPNDPVTYAIYEMARGGAHDFFGGLPAYEAHFEGALDGGFPG